VVGGKGQLTKFMTAWVEYNHLLGMCESSLHEKKKKFEFILGEVFHDGLEEQDEGRVLEKEHQPLYV
jgi:hypothetical protein